MLSIKHVTLPADQAITALGKSYCLGIKAEAYRKRLLELLYANQDGLVDPIGFCGVLRYALPQHSRDGETAALNAFPRVLALIEQTGSNALPFVAEVRKFTNQFLASQRTMR